MTLRLAPNPIVLSTVFVGLTGGQVVWLDNWRQVGQTVQSIRGERGIAVALTVTIDAGHIQTVTVGSVGATRNWTA